MKDGQQIEVLYEDNHLLVVNKPAGWLVQGDETGDMSLMDWAKAYIKARYNKPGDVFLAPAHRIDRPVSGIVLFGRTTKALSRLGKMFQEHKVEKTYLALVEHRPAELEARIEHYLIKDEQKNKASAYNKPKGKASKHSVLSFRLIAGYGSYHLLEVKPETGRPHQIRVQLAKIGCPIRGDIKYGAKQANPDGSIHLHSYGLRFEHPVKKEEIAVSVLPPNEQVWNNYRQTLAEQYKEVF